MENDFDRIIKNTQKSFHPQIPNFIKGKSTRIEESQLLLRQADNQSYFCSFRHHLRTCTTFGIATTNYCSILEVCSRWEFPRVPWVPWESHGIGNKGAMGMGMGMGIS